MLRNDRTHSGMRKQILWGGLFFFAVLLQLLARCREGFAEWYARTAYPAIARLLGGICGLFPFAVDELLAYLFAVGFVIYLAVSGKKLYKRELQPGAWLSRGLAFLARLGIAVFLLFTLNCGINYHRTEFSALAGLPAENASVEDLEGLCLWLTGRIGEAAGSLETDENGLCVLPPDMRGLTREAMARLGEQYPQLAGWYPKAKPVFTWPVLSYEFLEGIYGPYTIEAHYNPDIPAYNQPAVLCHELSHLKGFMREDEANYIAYLACTGSGNSALRYSGLLLAYTHSINALYAADPERGTAVRRLLCGQANRDYAYHREYWDDFRGPVSEVSDKVNDTYLRLNAQAAGSRSYGRMVDLLIGEYRQREAQGSLLRQ